MSSSDPNAASNAPTHAADDADRARGGALLVANELRRGVMSFARRLRMQRAPHGVAAAKLSVLGRLARADGPLTASELAVQERLQPQSLTRIIAELEEQGLIRREPDELDRRALRIELTDQGRQLLTEDAHRQNRWLALALVQNLTAAEMRLLGIAAELLEQLADTEVIDHSPRAPPP